VFTVKDNEACKAGGEVGTDPRLGRAMRAPLLLLPLFLIACAASPAAPPLATAAMPPAAAPCPSTPPIPAPPPGERWVPSASAARVQTGHLSEAKGFFLAAHVALDERQLARVYAIRSGIVESLDAPVGKRVHKGERLLTLETAHPMGKVAVASPIDGEVLSIGAVLGDAIAGVDVDPRGATQLAVVAELDRLLIVSDRAPPFAARGATAEFRTPRLPNKLYQMRVEAVAADDSRVRGAVDVPDRALRVGEAGSLHIEGPGASGFSLPRAARLPGEPAVLVRRGDGAPPGYVRYVELPVTVTFDGGGPFVAVLGPEPQDDVVLRAREVR